MRTDFLFNEFLLHTLKELYLSQNKFLKTFIDEFLLGAIKNSRINLQRKYLHE